eukprot:766292-Hanusia_phi.AAC.2
MSTGRTKIFLLQTKTDQAGQDLDIRQSSVQTRVCLALDPRGLPHTYPWSVHILYTSGRREKKGEQQTVRGGGAAAALRHLTRCIAAAKEQNPVVGKLGNYACTHSFRKCGISLLLSILDGPGKPLTHKSFRGSDNSQELHPSI